jgi:hypothetical protein
MQDLVRFTKDTAFAPMLYAPMITLLLLMGCVIETFLGHNEYAIRFAILGGAAAVPTFLAGAMLMVLYYRDTKRQAVNQISNRR